MEQVQRQRQRRAHGGDNEPASTFPEGYQRDRTPDRTAELLRRIDDALGKHGVRAAAQ